MTTINTKAFTYHHNTSTFTDEVSTRSKNIKTEYSITTSNYLENDRISISQQAREKLEQEEQALKEGVINKLKVNEPERAEDEKSEELDLLDKLIEQIKEQIKETQQELRQLQKDKSEQSQQEQKQLETKLMLLNNSLIIMYGKKLDALEKGSS